MSNARIFCIGWVMSNILCMIAEWFGYRSEPDIINMIGRLVLGVTFGVSAVAIFGDRPRQSHVEREG